MRRGLFFSAAPALILFFTPSSRGRAFDRYWIASLRCFACTSAELFRSSGLEGLHSAFFLPPLLPFPTLFLLGDGGVRNDENTRWQSLHLSLFLATLNIDIDIVRILPFLVEFSSLFPETSLV